MNAITAFLGTWFGAFSVGFVTAIVAPKVAKVAVVKTGEVLAAGVELGKKAQASFKKGMHPDIQQVAVEPEPNPA